MWAVGRASELPDDDVTCRVRNPNGDSHFQQATMQHAASNVAACCATCEVYYATCMPSVLEGGYGQQAMWAAGNGNKQAIDKTHVTCNPDQTSGTRTIQPTHTLATCDGHAHACIRMPTDAHGITSRSMFAAGLLLLTSHRRDGAPTILSSQCSPLSARAATELQRCHMLGPRSARCCWPRI